MTSTLSKLSFLFIICIVALLPACDRDEDIERIVQENRDFGIEIGRASFFGRLMDESGEPVADALIHAGDQSTRSDIDGHWELNSTTINLDHAYIRVEAEGYMHGSRTLNIRNNSRTEVEIELLSEQQPYTFQSSVGGNFPIQETGTVIRFPANAISRADGQPYNGEVLLSARYLDPSNPAIFRQMPGDLRALDSLGQPRVLVSFGMVAATLRTPSGEQLQIADGFTASLSISLPQEALAHAPASIPLWYFDQIAGVWKQEGQAHREGNRYLAEVGHFSFWNCDVPYPLVEICGRILQVRGESGNDTVPMRGAHIRISSAAYGMRGGFTDQDGQFCALVPANEPLDLLLFDRCGNMVTAATLGSFSSNTILGNIVFQGVTGSFHLRGQALCNGTAATQGSFLVRQDGQAVHSGRLNSDGSFAVDLRICSTEPVSVSVLDYGTLTRSAPLEIMLNSDTLDAGDIELCSQPITEFFFISIDGVEFGVEDWQCGINADFNAFWLAASGGAGTSNETGWIGCTLVSDSIRAALPAEGTHRMDGPGSQFGGAMNVGNYVYNFPYHSINETYLLVTRNEGPGGVWSGRIFPFRVPVVDSMRNPPDDSVTVSMRFSKIIN